MLLLSLTVVFTSRGQEAQTKKEKEAAYTKAITDRAAKIVAALGIDNEAKSLKVRDIIAGQYRNLNSIHERRDLAVKELKAEQNDKQAADAEIKKVQEKADAKLAKLHKKYLKSLGKQLSEGQVEKVKDGMTYGVLPITYRGYQQMLPDLSEEQKKQILAWLTEAREHAMDAESSEKKHAWFGKYKGRINNYLSASGIDMKQASISWQQRIKAEAEAKKNQ